ncbi:Pentatricopeptide repeat-containing protein, partial [Durusdinium trenchii]
QAAEQRASRSTVSYNATIVACGRSSQWQRSLSLLEELGISLTQTLPNQSGEFAGKESLNRLDDGRPATPRLQETGLTTSNIQGQTAARAPFLLQGCNATLVGCERAFHWRKALQLLVAMQESQVVHGSGSGVSWPTPDV